MLDLKKTEDLEKIGNCLVSLYFEVLSSCPREWFDIGFMKVKDIKVPQERKCDKCRNIFHTRECNDESIFIGKNYMTSSFDELKKDILETGVYWPLIVNSDNQLTDGTHKFTIYNEFINEGIWPEDKKVLVLKHKFHTTHAYSESVSWHLFRTFPVIHNLNYYNLPPHERKKVRKEVFEERAGSYFVIIKNQNDFHCHLYNIVKCFNIILKDSKNLKIKKPREINEEGYLFGDLVPSFIIKTTNKERSKLIFK